MKWPTIVIDDFLDDPDEIVKIANSFTYQKGPDGKWPGERSLFQADTQLDSFLLSRILKAVYPNTDNKEETLKYKAQAYFQKITQKEEGWIHSDEPFEFTAILYLTKNKKGGTSLYKPKSFRCSQKHSQYKFQYYQTGIKPEGYEKALRENNNQFEETMYFESIYNRLIVFDSYQIHGVKEYNTSSNEPRLTYVGFFEEVIGLNLKTGVLESKRKQCL